MSSHAPEFGQGEGTLSRAAGLVAEARKDFDRLGSKLDGQIAAVQGKWGGQGAQAFFILQRSWSEKQRTVVSALDEFDLALRQTERDNIRTDESQNQSYGALAARLG